MTSFELNHLDELCDRARIHTATALIAPDPIRTTPWIAVSLLQKAIRRGEIDHALGAAVTLLRDDPQRFWRRLGIIAFEDVGIGGPELTGPVLAAMAGKTVRAKAGGEWAVASRLVALLAHSNKCRAVDDLVMIAEVHPRYAGLRLQLAAGDAALSAQCFKEAQDIETKAVALWSFHGFLRDSSSKRRTADIAVAFELLDKAGVPPDVLDMCRTGYRRIRESLALILPLILAEKPSGTMIVQDHLPPEAEFGGIPLWAVDKFTREGRAALGLFLKSGTPTARWISHNVPSTGRIEVLGRLVFAVEGGQMRNRLSWPLADRFRQTWQHQCLGFQCPDGAEALALLPEEIPLLNELRAKCLCH